MSSKRMVRLDLGSPSKTELERIMRKVGKAVAAAEATRGALPHLTCLNKSIWHALQLYPGFLSAKLSTAYRATASRKAHHCSQVLGCKMLSTFTRRIRILGLEDRHEAFK